MTDDRPNSYKLAERCEAAMGPERELDRAIWLALCGPADRQVYEDGLAISEQEANFRADYMAGGVCYTASLDAALQLVPKGWDFHVSREQGLGVAGVYDPAARVWNNDHIAATPALALTAAALRARAIPPVD